eukprot:augustus_masked-scaffold_3-processed-gene-13.51-mRNA-1 protein AED:1.00 eAED:1.00 QI:0/-1/0/0/-1/1/1/0/86
MKTASERDERRREREEKKKCIEAEEEERRRRKEEEELKFFDSNSFLEESEAMKYRYDEEERNEKELSDTERETLRESLNLTQNDKV